MPRRLTVGAFTPSVLLSVARRTGRLDDAGLDVEELPVASSPGQFRALLSGDLDVAFTSPDNVLVYRFGPTNPLGMLADVRIVSTVDRGMGLGLYARPGVDSVEQLRGATLGVDVPVSGFAVAMYALTAARGVRRSDYAVVELGSTPRRLEALLAGECDATMLNAGNELVAERGGAGLLAAVSDVCSPYVGTVVCVEGERRLDDARRLAEALRFTATDIGAGRVDDVIEGEARARLGLTAELAGRYLDRMKSSTEGVIADDAVDLAGLRTIVGLRRQHLPGSRDGADPLTHALDPTSGLVDAGAAAH